MWDEVLVPFIELLILCIFISGIPGRKVTLAVVTENALALLFYICLRIAFINSYDICIMVIRVACFCVFCCTLREVSLPNGIFLSASLSLIFHAIILFYYNVPYLSQYVKQWFLGDTLCISLIRLAAALALRQTAVEVAKADIEGFEYLLLLISYLGYVFDIDGFITGATLHVSNMDTSIVLFMYCFSTILAVLASFWHIISRGRQAEVQRINRILEEQYIMWNQKAERDAAIHRMYHDMKHQIGLLENLESEAGQKLTKALKHSVERYSRVLDTGDAILNTMLNEKANQCVEKGIRFRCVTNFDSLEPVESLDLCAIVGNALDNAIEAVEQQEEKNREIRVTIAQKEKFLVFRFENPFKGPIRMEQGRILTTKPDASQHGIGLGSIRYSVEKYGGAISVETAGGIFLLKILIPR